MFRSLRCNINSTIHMVHPITTDILPLLRNLVEALQPFAEAHLVALRFEADQGELVIAHHPEALMPDLTQLLCRVVTFTPEKHAVILRAGLLDTPELYCLQLSVVNSGSNLCRLLQIIAGLKQPVQVTSSDEPPGTRFDWLLLLERPFQAPGEVPLTQLQTDRPFLKQFYDEMRKRLSSHFSDPVNMERVVSGRSPREGAFLQKVNAIITAHLNEEHFDVQRLCKALAMSRTQLYRRLCPLIRQSPARYVRLLRLQKAKELLEAGELSIGEIVLRTGFQSQSHFTRIFQTHFGVRPSAFRRQPKPKT